MLSVVGLDAASAFYVRQAPPRSSVLVLGAADGQVACALASRGHEVVAVEPSAALLALAIERREIEAPRSSLRFVNEDLRTVRLARKFAAVFAPRNALGSMSSEADARAFAKTMAEHLAPDGVLALDVLAAPADDEEDEDEGAQRPLRSPVPHLHARKGIHRLRHRRYSAAEVDVLLADAELEARERYADFQETPFSADAERQVVIGGPAPG